MAGGEVVMNPLLQIKVGVSFDDMTPSVSWNNHTSAEPNQDSENNEHRTLCVIESHIELSV
jgi:hypothetical protein